MPAIAGPGVNQVQSIVECTPNTTAHSASAASATRSAFQSRLGTKLASLRECSRG